MINPTRRPKATCLASLIIRAGFYAATVLLLYPVNALARPNGTASAAVASEQAIAQLKQAGEFASLAEAVTAAQEADGQNFVQEQELTDGGGQPDNFGQRVAISGKTAVVSTASTGVYVFVRTETSWTLQQKLTRTYDEANDHSRGFGKSVAIDGDTLVVGDTTKSYAQDARFTAHVYVRSGNQWSLQQGLHPSTDAATAFGACVAISASTILVAASEENTNPNPQNGGYDGAVYVFVRSGSTWVQQQKLTPSTGPKQGEGFGSALALEGDTAVVGIGAPFLYHTASGAYIFVRNGAVWSEQQKLVPPDPSHVSFGKSVALSGDTVFVGAPDFWGPQSQGSTTPRPVYAFTRTGTSWQLHQSLYASDGYAADNYGVAVAIDGDLAVIGASPQDFENNRAGDASVYVFARDGSTWIQQQKLTSGYDYHSGFWGANLAISENRFVVGGASANDSAGGAYIFKAPMVRLQITVPEDAEELNGPFTANVVLR